MYVSMCTKTDSGEKKIKPVFKSVYSKDIISNILNTEMCTTNEQRLITMHFLLFFFNDEAFLFQY